MEIQKATLVEILPTQIWIENGICGDRSVVLQHQGMEPFVYARFGYNYAYTSNAGTWDAAQQMALSLGATEPIEVRSGAFPEMPTADELREQIAELTDLLATLEPDNVGAQREPKAIRWSNQLNHMPRCNA